MGREESMASSRAVPAWACWATYFAALTTQVIVFRQRGAEDSAGHTGFFAIMLSTVAIYGFSFMFSNSSLYDPAWCLLPIFCALGWAGFFDVESAASVLGVWTSLSGPQQATLSLLLVWYSRYALAHPWPGWNIFKGLSAYEDWRYVDLARKVGSDKNERGTALYWGLSFTSFHLTPSLLVYLALLPLAPVLSARPSNGSNMISLRTLPSIAALMMCLGAVLLTAAADRSLQQFRLSAYASAQKVSRQGRQRKSSPARTRRPAATQRYAAAESWIHAAEAGALLLCSGIGTGAFGAHGLKSVLEPMQLQWWNTAVHYHLVSGCALLALGGTKKPSISIASFSPAGIIFTGTVVFSGSLYALALGSSRKMGMITPIGGALMMLGWGFAAFDFRRRRQTLSPPEIAKSNLPALDQLAGSEKVCRQGLWSLSRHPNYLGEALFWCSLSFLAWSFRLQTPPLQNGAAEDLSRHFWDWGGCVVMILFFRLSAGLMDARNMQHRPVAYASVMKEISALIPFFP